jgi:uncharacterized alkaline shock family protein YloU
MEEKMTDSAYSAGITTIAPEVLLTIARSSALSVEGVAELVPASGLRRFRHRGDASGVHVNVEDGVVYMDIYLILHQDVNVREVSRQVQQQVSRAISEMLSMEIGHINIHIEDIRFD